MIGITPNDGNDLLKAVHLLGKRAELFVARGVQEMSKVPPVSGQDNHLG